MVSIKVHVHVLVVTFPHSRTVDLKVFTSLPLTGDVSTTLETWQQELFKSHFWVKQQFIAHNALDLYSSLSLSLYLWVYQHSRCLFMQNVCCDFVTCAFHGLCYRSLRSNEIRGLPDFVFSEYSALQRLWVFLWLCCFPRPHSMQSFTIHPFLSTVVQHEKYQCIVVWYPGSQ